MTDMINNWSHLIDNNSHDGDLYGAVTSDLEDVLPCVLCGGKVISRVGKWVWNRPFGHFWKGKRTGYWLVRGQT